MSCRPGTPFTRAAPSTSSMSPGDASRSSPARRSALSRTFLRRSRDGIAARHQRAARERPGAPVEPARVAGHDGDVGRRAAERLRGDLGERRLVALPLGREAGRDEDPAARLDPHVRALVRPDPRSLDVAADPQTEVATFGARGRLPRAKLAARRSRPAPSRGRPGSCRCRSGSAPPSWNVSPTSHGNSSGWIMFRRRTSAGSRPSSRAMSPMTRSITKTPCGRPAPRYGVTITLFV